MYRRSCARSLRVTYSMLISRVPWKIPALTSKPINLSLSYGHSSLGTIFAVILYGPVSPFLHYPIPRSLTRIIRMFDLWLDRAYRFIAKFLSSIRSYFRRGETVMFPIPARSNSDPIWELTLKRATWIVVILLNQKRAAKAKKVYIFFSFFNRCNEILKCNILIFISKEKIKRWHCSEET